jgi:hypothetical protein
MSIAKKQKPVKKKTLPDWVQEENRLYAEYEKDFDQVTENSIRPKRVTTIYPRLDEFGSCTRYLSISIVEDIWIVEKGGGSYSCCGEPKTWFFNDPQKVVDLVNVCVDYWSRVMPTNNSVPLPLRNLTTRELLVLAEKPRSFSFSESRP